MSSISEWLRMEQRDTAEPAGFYFPGAVRWSKPPIALPPDCDEWDIHEYTEQWEKDEQ